MKAKTTKGHPVSEWATAAPLRRFANVASQETSIAPANQPSNANREFRHFL